VGPAAPAHHEFTMFPDGGPALEASWSRPTFKKLTALAHDCRLLGPWGAATILSAWAVCSLCEVRVCVR